ncbi:MAG: hypothetical protein LPK45_06585 [Bacteroidota bacterium]|nr:hypothetical protein [Bacteroidota bacterium]MDX5430739.1 hypothetical protein [Bacteroidota bacterium]MDX5469486.1 hypothetical protein [Bacteroidota bacterium]
MQSLDILLSYPAWYLLLCLVLAGVGAWLLYQKPLFGEEDQLKLRRLLGGLRFVFLFLLLFLLLEPLIKTSIREVEKPVIALVYDDSRSILMQADSSALRQELENSKALMEERLGDDHEVQVFYAGSGLVNREEANYQEVATNLSQSLKDLDNRFENQNLGALVLFSDGIVNQGSNPIYSKRKSTAPIYTVTLGDTSRQRDLILKEVRHNQLAYLGNQFPLVVVAGAHDLAGKTSRLVVKKDDKVLYEKSLLIDESNWNSKIEISLKAEAPGMQRYDIFLETVEGESSKENNRRTVYLEVIDARNKVLILALAPHPDLAAMKSAILANENYEVEMRYASDNKPIAWQELDLLILHQLPTLRSPIINVLEGAEKFGTPVFFVLAENSNLNQIKTWVPGLSVQTTLNSVNNALPVFHPDFQLFQLEEATRQAIQKFPPLYCPFGNYFQPAPSSVLLQQKIGNIESGDPLLAFAETDNQKFGMLYGEGYWRWRLYDFDQHGNHQASNDILQKSIQYLGAKKDKRPFKAYPSKLKFAENEALSFRAELYNASYQLINEPEVSLEVKNKDNTRYTFQFGRDQHAYFLDAGFLEPGDYSYVAKTSYNGNAYESSGLFSIQALELEGINTQADFKLLTQLAEKNGGKAFRLSEINQIADAIQANEAIHSTSYLRSSLKDLIRLPWIFWILIAFISTEWFVRKFKGAY